MFFMQKNKIYLKSDDSVSILNNILFLTFSSWCIFMQVIIFIYGEYSWYFPEKTKILYHLNTISERYAEMVWYVSCIHIQYVLLKEIAWISYSLIFSHPSNTQYPPSQILLTFPSHSAYLRDKSKNLQNTFAKTHFFYIMCLLLPS